MVPEQFDRLTEDVGGFNNASTNDDYTNYYEVVPANHLQRLLWAEAERMGSLVVEPGFFASERDVVKEELRSRVLAAPYGRLFYLYLPQISYDVHPYAPAGHRQHRGSRRGDDRGRARLPRHLLPARQCGAGRRRQFRSGAARPLGRPIFRADRAARRRRSRASPRASRSAPQARRYTVYEPNTPLPAVLISYPAPPATRPRRGGDGGARRHPLDRRELAAAPEPRLSRPDRRARPAPSSTSSRAAARSPSMRSSRSGQSAEAGEAALRREIARFRDAPVSAAELAEAKNELLTAALRERETVDGQASAIAEAVIVDGDAARRRPPARRDRRGDAGRHPARRPRAGCATRRSAAVRYLPEESAATARARTRSRTAADRRRRRRWRRPPNIAIVQPAPEARAGRAAAAGPGDRAAGADARTSSGSPTG